MDRIAGAITSAKILFALRNAVGVNLPAYGLRERHGARVRGGTRQQTEQ
jgi:hypothetical protein